MVVFHFKTCLSPGTLGKKRQMWHTQGPSQEQTKWRSPQPGSLVLTTLCCGLADTLQLAHLCQAATQRSACSATTQIHSKNKCLFQ